MTNHHSPTYVLLEYSWDSFVAELTQEDWYSRVNRHLGEVLEVTKYDFSVKIMKVDIPFWKFVNKHLMFASAISVFQEGNCRSHR